jgi:alpha-acetolactate decarboxylase
MLKVIRVACLLALFAATLGVRNVVAADTEIWDGQIVQYGKMHEAIGQQQHQGRVQLSKLSEWPHFYGVAALAKLEGEVTLLGSNVTMTCVDAKGQLTPREGSGEESATLLVGAYVPSWTQQKGAKRVSPDEFDKYVAESAIQAGLNVSEPFVFTIEGEFSKLSFHVINGACPLHARLKKIKLDDAKRPFEAEFEKIKGTIIGVFAKDAVGNITHPATSTHMHLVFRDDKSGQLMTGHVEQIGVLEGAVLRLPRVK